MEKAIIIFLLQVFLFTFRTMNVIQISKRKKVGTVLTAVLFQSCWLFSAYVGFNGIEEGNWLVIIFFLFGTAIGSWIGSFNLFKNLRTRGQRKKS